MAEESIIYNNEERAKGFLGEAQNLINEIQSKAPVDKHLADQILPYLALTSEKFQVMVSEITNHCKTNIWVIEKFLGGKFEIKENLITWQKVKS